MDLLAITVTEASLAFLKKGGPFMIPLILCSIAAITAICFKALSLTRSRIIPSDLEQELESKSDQVPETLQSKIKTGSSSLARLSAVALSKKGQAKADITQSIESAAREEVVKMHAGIGVLDVVITVAPLLGLLGTASGLVTIFQGLGETTDHLAIARGIAEALNTTIFGLAIAVPCVIAHSYFTRRIERFTARMEAILANFASNCAR
jgi:biopolymer transport protein ExbB